MGLPGVNIAIQNGALGSVAVVDDGIVGLIAGGVAAAGLALSTPVAIYSLQDAEDLGIDEAYDTDNTVNVHAQITDFYKKAGNGSKLWLMLVSNATLMADVVDNTGEIAPKLLNAANGEIKVLGVIMDHDGAFVPTYVNGFDDDAYAAALAAQDLVRDYQALNIPLRVVIEGRDFQGDENTLVNLREGATNGAMICLDGLKAGSKAAAVGRLLGKIAGISVQRNIGRVKDGDLGLAAAYLSDGNTLETLSPSQWDVLHDRGYVFLRKFQGKSGYYYNDDNMATALTDDYKSLANCRVIDKAHRIAYLTYLDELLDDLEISEEGQLAPAVIKSYQAKIENAIELQMRNEGEISSVSATLDPTQNVLSTDKVKVVLQIVPKGYSKAIEVELGFSNPALNN